VAKSLSWLTHGCLLWWACQAWAQPVQLILLQEPLTPSEEVYLTRALNWIVKLYQRQGLQPTPRLRARIFSTYPAFQSYQQTHRSFQDGSQPSHSGYYSIGQQELVTWRKRGLLPLFIHESQHALLRSDFARPPKWINEGLSECFEGFDFSQELPKPLPQAPRLRKVKRLLGDDFGQRVLEVTTMSERDFNRWANDSGLDSYTRSWALVYFLWSQPDGEDHLGELLRCLKRGDDVGEILDRLVEGSLEEQLVDFYRQLPDPPPLTRDPFWGGAR
jgi:hypothetical protein